MPPASRSRRARCAVPACSEGRSRLPVERERRRGAEHRRADLRARDVDLVHLDPDRQAGGAGRGRAGLARRARLQPRHLRRGRPASGRYAPSSGSAASGCQSTVASSAISQAPSRVTQLETVGMQAPERAGEALRRRRCRPSPSASRLASRPSAAPLATATTTPATSSTTTTSTASRMRPIRRIRTPAPGRYRVRTRHRRARG